MERRLAAILAGDVVGYSRMMAEDEAATFASLRAGLDEVVVPCVAQHGGHVFKTTGDGFLASFPSVNEALDAGLAIQEGFAGRPMRLRLGLNLGDVIAADGDVFGDGVNVAARLQGLAEPGGICVSAAVVRGAANRPGVRFARLGRRRVKNIPERLDVYAVQHRAMPRRKLPWRALAASLLVLAIAGGTAWQYGDRAAAAIGSLSLGLLGGGSPEASDDGRPVVAVLPFDNLGGDPAEDYFTDGLTEDIITDLARSPELLVIARNSTFAFKDQPTDIRTVGEALGARYVVEGSARRADDRLRVVAQLIDTGSGAHLWSRSYDRQLADVFAVQADLTAQIVASLVSYVRQSESAAAASRPTESLRAYELVLQGRERYAHGAKDARALHDARALFARAIALDPDYAAAHAHLGLTYIIDSMNDITGAATAQSLDEGLRQARDAIRLQPDLAQGYQILSYGLAVAGDYPASLQAGLRAVELNPSDPDSLMSLAKAQVRFGAYPEAVANAERARRLHPMAPEYYPYVHGQALYAAGRAEEAEAVLGECLLRAPREPNCLRIRAATLVRLDRLPEARADVATLRELEPAFSLVDERQYRRFGDSPLMDRYLAELASAGVPQGPGQARAADGAA